MFGKIAALAAIALLARFAAVAILARFIDAQPAPTAAPKYDVASVKPCKLDPGQRGGGGNSSPGRLNVQCSSVRGLIRQAYLLFANGHFLVGLPAPAEGGPAWIDSENYQIDARAESRVPLEMMNGPMLQALLEDRFKLRAHLETREAPVYALTIAKSGPKLERFQEGSCTPVDRTVFPPFAGLPAVRAVSPNPVSPDAGSNDCRARPSKEGPNLQIDAQGMTVDEFCKLFLDSHTVDRLVIDKTGLTGRFNFHLKYALDGVPVGDTGLSSGMGPSIFTALQEQLGLKLEPTRGPKEFLVIDYVERPSPN